MWIMLDLLLFNSDYILWTKRAIDQIVSSYISRMVLLTNQLLLVMLWQPLPCPFCDRIFKQDGRFKEHLKNKHADEELQESVVSEDSGQGDQATITTENVQNPQRDEHGYPIKSPKTLLHEWCQKNKKPQPKFKAVSGPYLECAGFEMK